MLRSVHTEKYKAKKGGDTMKTAEEILAYIELAKKEALELHEEAKGKDAEQALFQLIVATTLEHLLEEIKEA